MDRFRLGGQRNPKSIQDALKILAEQLNQPAPQFDRPYMSAVDNGGGEEAAHQQQVQAILRALMEKFRSGGGMPALGGGPGGLV